VGIFRRRTRDHGEHGVAVAEHLHGDDESEPDASDHDGQLAHDGQPGHDEQPLVDPDERSPELGLKYKDLRVLGALVERGADMSQPRHVLHYLYASDPADAEPAAEVARGRGFDVTVDEPIPEHPGAWPIRCEKLDVVLSADVVRDDGTFFDELAARFDLEYDGWEASV
jgi:regulator of RNase E activity RraB